ncbi:MAG: hypothetical protein ACKOYG_09615 [Ilumatobacteraceae bacterium]
MVNVVGDDVTGGNVGITVEVGAGGFAVGGGGGMVVAITGVSGWPRTDVPPLPIESATAASLLATESPLESVVVSGKVDVTPIDCDGSETLPPDRTTTVEVGSLSPAITSATAATTPAMLHPRTTRRTGSGRRDAGLTTSTSISLPSPLV